MVALSQGKRPIVVPRLSRFGEAVDDHQLPFARRLAERGLVTLLEDESELASGDRPTSRTSWHSTAPAGSGLAEDLAAYLRSLVDGTRG